MRFFPRWPRRPRQWFCLLPALMPVPTLLLLYAFKIQAPFNALAVSAVAVVELMGAAALVSMLRDLIQTALAAQGLQAENIQLAGTISELQSQLDLIHDQKTAMEQTNERLEALATTDGLTGLKNHRSFQDRLNEEFERSQRYNSSLSVMLLDVDKFKAYNDKFGHPAGDKVLKQVADVLRATARATDVVARYGGEEFVVILPETEEDARAVAERYRLAIASAPWPDREVTASFGLSTLTPDVMHASTLVAEADAALYRSKQRGRNCVTHAFECDHLPLWDKEATRWYEELLQQLLASQTESLQSASEHIRETLTRAFDATIEGWSQMLDMRDQETQGHSKRVSILTERLARFIGMNESEVLYIRWGALLHDIGKIGVPDYILQKPGPLNDAETGMMQRHTTLGHQMLAPIAFLQAAVDIPYCHHERWDGLGYPQGLKEDEIPISARLFAVVDVYDALRSDRPYRKPWSETRVRQYLRAHSGTHFDPRAVRAFLRMLQEEKEQSKAA